MPRRVSRERAHIRDPRGRELADSIIEAQMQEIAEMQALIADLDANPVRVAPRTCRRCARAMSL